MTNFQLLYDTRTWDAATVTASDTKGGSPSNVLKDQIAKSWLSNGFTGKTLTFDLASASATYMLGIFAHNLTAAATVHHLANTSNVWSGGGFSGGYDSGALTVATDGDSRVLPRLVYTLNRTYRWHRFTFDDPTNTASEGGIKIGRVMGGSYYTFVRNFALRGRISYKDANPITHLPGSVENVVNDPTKRFREIRLDFPRRTATEKRKLRAIFGLCGISRPMVLALDIDNYPSEMSAYGYLVADMEEVLRTYEMSDFLTMVFGEKTF